MDKATEILFLQTLFKNTGNGIIRGKFKKHKKTLQTSETV